jgi:hypothetical protein
MFKYSDIEVKYGDGVKQKDAEKITRSEIDREQEIYERYTITPAATDKFELIVSKAIRTVLDHGSAFSISSNSTGQTNGLRWSNNGISIEYVNLEKPGNKAKTRQLSINYSDNKGFAGTVLKVIVADGDITEILSFAGESGENDYNFRWVERLNLECYNATRTEGERNKTALQQLRKEISSGSF